MTSRSCTKSYHRKVNTLTSGSIQFDKIVKENSSKPVAAKSAGTVGKWGKTSFTSIRSAHLINGTLPESRGHLGQFKRMKLDQGASNTPSKSLLANAEKEVKTETIVKPKKFFTSRTTLSQAKPVEDLKKSDALHHSTSTKIYKNHRRHSHSASGTIQAKITESDADRDEAKPPIVLRICKGTARLISAEDVQPEPQKPASPTKLKSDTLDLKPEVHTTSPTRVPVLDDNCERRTTRSRAKILGHSADVASQSAATSTSPSTSGISLTLRKSSTDSMKKSASHYDIIKSEPLIPADQPLPTTTQELIQILTSDEESKNSAPILKENVSKKIETKEQLVEEKEGIDKVNIDNVSVEKTDSNLSKDENLLEPVKVEKMDQDCVSNSDDSDSVNGNIQNEPLIVAGCETKTIVKKVSAPVKKGSIFKSRSAGGSTSGIKRRAVYKHKWSDNDKDLKSPESKQLDDKTKSICTNLLSLNSAKIDEEELENTPLTRFLSCAQSKENEFDEDNNSVTGLRCNKNVKGFYTVVKNVKKAHQIQESGEFQEFNDDIEYILDTLGENNPNATRCLSAIRLGSKCMAPAFRMHVRAHGTVAKFFKALQDSTKNQSLALCTATVMFVLSQDRLAMDLDRDCLELMLNLLECDASHKNALEHCGLSQAELLKNQEKVRQICADIQAQGHAKHLNLDNITVGQLAMETLLSLTSKRAGEWFKEELRELGGLEHIVKTIKECFRHVNLSDIHRYGWAESLLEKLQKVDRCLRVLENVTSMNEENQIYLLKYDKSVLVTTLTNLYGICAEEIMKYPTMDPSDKTSAGAIIRECLFAIIKVLINLTHRFNSQSFGGKLVGSQVGIICESLKLILLVPKYLPEEKRFDIMMLALIFLTNLIEQCDDNKHYLVTSTLEQCSGLEALINLFYIQEDLARVEEQKTDAILDGKKDTEEQTEPSQASSKTHEEFIEETVAKLLQKAGRHMEHTLIAAYVVILLGNLIMDKPNYEDFVRSKVQDGKFTTMIAVLQKFFNFMNLTASNEISSGGIAATEKVIKFLKAADNKLDGREESCDVESVSMSDSSIISPECSSLS